MPRGYGRAPPNVVPREIPQPRQPRREKKARGPQRKRKLGVTSVYFVKTQLRLSYSLRRKARISSYMETPSVVTGYSGKRYGREAVRCPTVKETQDRTKIPYNTLLDWRRPANRAKIFSRAAGLRRVRLGVPKWPEMEDKLVERFLAARRQGKPVRLRWFRRNTQE
jgi:hypothetical protein